MWSSSPPCRYDHPLPGKCTFLCSTRPADIANFSLKQVLSLPLAPIEILDIGAREEGQDRYQPLRDVGLARVTGFEPDEEHCAALQASAAETDRYLPYYLGTGETSVFRS